MKSSIVIVVYNSFELTEACIEATLKNATGDHEIIIVDNHSLDERTRGYLVNVAEQHKDIITLIDAGSNLGCHRGFVEGFKHARGDYFFKLDDDSVPITQGFNEIMIDTLEAWNRAAKSRMAFIASDSNIKQVTESRDFVIKTTTDEGDKKWNLTLVVGGVLGFSCVMIPQNIYQELGPLESRFWADNEVKKDSLYGGEELYYCQKAIKAGYVYGYAMDAKIEHLSNEHRDPDFVLWKWMAGFRGSFNGDLSALKNDKEMLISGYNDWLQNGNNWHKETANKRLNELNDTPPTTPPAQAGLGSL